MNEITYQGKYAFVDGYKFTKDYKTGYYLGTKKIGRKRWRLHDYMWRKYNGEKPKNLQIHHIDKNKDNNEIENLVLLTQKEHSLCHKDYSEERKQQCRILLNKIRDKASDWHRSEEGRKWHSLHAKEPKKPKKLICANCGKEFLGYAKKENNFCSNNCKTAFRRKLGIDNEIRQCAACDENFVVNKYAKRKYCDKHKGKRSKDKVD